MKQEKGITTASVIVYVIIITIAISLLSVITGYFRQVLNTNLKQNKDYEKYISFATYFVQDVQEEGNKILTTQETEIGEENKIYYIQFSNGNIYQYSTENKVIYRNQIAICENVDLCQFISQEKNGKQEIKVNFSAGRFNKTQENALVFYM